MSINLDINNDPELRYRLESMSRIKEYVEQHKKMSKLRLAPQQVLELSQILYECTGLRSTLKHEGLSLIEQLDLILSMFLSTSMERAQILGSSPGALRISSYRALARMEANNRLHAIHLYTKQCCD